MIKALVTILCFALLTGCATYPEGNNCLQRANSWVEMQEQGTDCGVLVYFKGGEYGQSHAIGWYDKNGKTVFVEPYYNWKTTLTDKERKSILYKSKGKLSRTQFFEALGLGDNND